MINIIQLKLNSKKQIDVYSKIANYNRFLEII